jgi:hypothetical protein
VCCFVSIFSALGAERDREEVRKWRVGMGRRMGKGRGEKD